MFLFFLSIDVSVCLVLSSRQPLSYRLLSRDFVPGYSRYARYCLPGNSTNQQLNNKTTKQQNNQTTRQQDQLMSLSSNADAGSGIAVGSSLGLCLLLLHLCLAG